MPSLQLSFVLAASVMAAGAQGATITVTSLADSTLTDGQVTLREAIVAANTDTSVDGSTAGSGADEIVFATGPGTIVLGGTQLPAIAEALTITGLGAPRLIIDGNQASRVFEILAGVTVRLAELTIRGGQVVAAPANGGGVLNAGILTVANSEVSANAVAANGGGIWSDGSLTLTDSTLADNSALNGGGVFSRGSLQVSGTTFRFNFTGGLAPFAGGGGAILNSGTATITTSLFSSNSAANGGAVGSSSGSLTLTSSTLVFNEAVNNGGAVSSAGSTALTVTGCTVNDNRADGNDDGIGSGGGISIFSGLSVRLDNTVVADNFSMPGIRQDLAGTVQAASSGNILSVDSGVVGISHGTNGNQIGTLASPIDPLLEFLANNGGPTLTRAPMPGSPVLEGGSAGTCSAVDQRGVPRPLDGDNDGLAVCDVGAYEAFAVAPVGASFYALNPCRIADTRGPRGPAGGPSLAAGTSRFFPVAGLCGIPSDARAVALNVTVVNETDLGNLRLYPAGVAAPTASTINFAVGVARANNAMLPLGAGGQIAVQCDMPPDSIGTTNVVLDVFGYLK